MARQFRICKREGFAFAAIGMAITVVSVMGSNRAAAATAATAPTCDARSTVVWLMDRGNPGAGSAWYTVALTNLSAHPCDVRGYPGVSAVDLARRQLGSAAARNARDPVRTVTLGAGASAQFLLQVHDPGFFPRAKCRPVRAAALQVYLPGSTRPNVIPVPLGACSLTGPVFLRAAAVTG